MNEFWRSLGLTPGASPEQIKKAYRAMVNKHHPDKEGGSAEKFREVHHAYKMLSDPSYSYQNTPKEQPITLNVAVSIEQAVFGTTILHSISKRVCPMPSDDNKNIVTHAPAQFEDVIAPGTLRFPHTIMRTGVDLGGGKPATVVVVYTAQDHPYYRVTPDGRILVNLELTAIEAMKGTKKEIQTLFGIRTLRIPPGTVPEDMFQIRNHGHLAPLVVRVAGIKYPRKAELKAEADYQTLGINWVEEEGLEKQEQEELERLFQSLGGKPI